MRFQVDNSLYLTPEAQEWVRRAEQQGHQTHRHTRRLVAPHRHQGTRNADGPISRIGLVAVILLVLGVMGFREIERAHRPQQTANTVIQMQAQQQRHVVPRRHVAPRRPRREPAKKPVITSSWKRVALGADGDLWNSPYTSGRVIGRIESGSYIQYQEFTGGWYRIITEDGKHGFTGLLFPQTPTPKRVVPKKRVVERARCNSFVQESRGRIPQALPEWNLMRLTSEGKLWNSPYVGARVIARIPPNSILQYQKSVGDWYKVITPDGNRGYTSFSLQ